MAPHVSCHTHRGGNLIRFVNGSPDFAVIMRCDGDTTEERRADFIEAGTTVVWDVDPEAEKVTVYRASAPEHPTVFRRGEIADAEPAVPGWRMAVDEVFE